MSRNLLSLCFVIAALAGLIFGLTRQSAGPRASGHLPSACYVWQRAWEPSVSDSVRDAPPAVEGLAPLCAEIAWTGRASVAWPRIDYKALQQSKRPVSAVLRVGSCKATEDAGGEVCAIATKVVSRLREEGIEPSELQIDFDCAESQLGGYREWLSALRHAAAPLPVRPTVLPSWLSRHEFAALASECGGYILQVHATRRPEVQAAETALCETADARKWVEQAGRIGVPFRVALPTYTYQVAFAAGGQILGIDAEGSGRAWPPEVRLRHFRPDAAQLASLVRDWNSDRPASLQGLIWYRLPVPADVQNWRWPTLLAVMQGRELKQRIEIEKSGHSPTDLVVVNTGDIDAPLPVRIVAKCVGDIAEADGVGGYAAEISGNSAVFTRDPRSAELRIPPGERRPLGWLRASSDVEVRSESL